jgi:DNA-binding NarL/FixJ family response regulator
MTGNPRIKILTVDVHPLMREALARVITEMMARDALARIMMEAGPRAEVLEADSLATAQERLAVHTDMTLVVLEIALPDASGTEAIERVRTLRPGVPILVLSAQDDPATARAALDAGARGFISKRSPTLVLTEALRLVLAGGTYVPPQALRAIAPGKPDQGAGLAAPDAPRFTPLKSLGLTPRQVDVLALLVQGKSNKLICRTLNLAEGTVKTHTAAIYRALGAMNRTQAVYAVNRLGLVLPAAGEVYQRAIEASGTTTRVIRLLRRPALQAA